MASTSQRRRQLARAKWDRQQQRRAQTVRERRRVLAAVSVLVLVGALVASVALLGQRGDTTDTPVADPATDPATDEPREDDAPADGAMAADGTCVYRESGQPVDGLPMPPLAPQTAATTATFTLSGQAVTVALLAEDAPCTVNSFVHLVEHGYYDGTPCHRTTSSASLRVLQCGDPTGTGSGGPGYQYGLENTDGATYPAGTVAMARRGDDPNSNGSQFFLVYDDSDLPPDYTVFGQITEGLDVVAGIAARGTADGSTDGEPAEPVTLDDLDSGP